MSRFTSTWRALAAAALVALFAAPTAVRAQELTVWSHWAAEVAKRAYIEDAIKRFEASRPGVKVKITWYEKSALYASLKTALRAGQAPDVFYAEVDQTDYIDNNLLADLSTGINWANVEPWAKQAWTFGKGTYGFPLEASTVEVYYNTKLMNDLGVKVPASGQFTQAEFLDLVKKAKAKGITPMSQGVGDRPFPGSYVTHEALLKKLGPKDYDALMKGTLSWSDPRVVETLTCVKQLVDAGAFPASFTSLKLGESHIYFHTNPGRADVPGGELVHRARLQSAGQGRPAGRLPARHHAVAGDEQRRLQPVQVDGGRRQLRRQRRVAAQGARHRLPELVRHRRRWATAGSRTCWCRPGSRPTRRRSAARMPTTSSSSPRPTRATPTTSARRCR